MVLWLGRCKIRPKRYNAFVKKARPILERFFGKNEPIPIAIHYHSGKYTRPNILTYHREGEVHFFRRGTGGYFIEGRNYAFKRYSVIIIHPGEIHNFVPIPGVQVERISLQYLPEFLGRDQGILAFTPECPRSFRLEDRQATRLEMLVRQIDEELGNNFPNRPAMLAWKLKEYLCLVKRYATGNSAQPEASNPAAEQLIAYIELNFAAKINLPALVEKFGYSADYLSMLCKKLTGLSVKQYIFSRRILEAKRLLEGQPALTIAAIAEKVGYDNLALFNRAFKIHTGHTPGQYRRIITGK